MKPGVRRAARLLFQALIFSPAAWLVGGGVIFWTWSGLLPKVSWNAIELMMAKNWLAGSGLIVAPLDPPALWRPLLGPLVCVPVECVTSDPFLIYRIIYTASLTVLLVCSFYAARKLWDVAAGHLACLFIVTNGAITDRLITHVHSISHVVFLLAIGPALLMTVSCMRKPVPRLLLATGVAWGVAYLARWEALFFFGITAVGLFAVVWGSGKSWRGALRIWPLAIGFALIWIPAGAYISGVKKRHDLWGPSAATTFYASQAWVNGTEDEDAGFAESQQLYGTLESNNFSIVRAIARNPTAFSARLDVNISKFSRLFRERKFFDRAWLLLLIGLPLRNDWNRQRLISSGMLALFFVCSSVTIWCFHVDPRYLVVGLPSALLILSGGVGGFSRIGRLFFPQAGFFAAVIWIIVLGRHSGKTSMQQMKVARANPVRAAGPRAVELAQTLALHFRATVNPAQPTVLEVLPSRRSELIPTDMLLVSYYANTALVWQPLKLYPRDKIFSMRPKNPRYVYAPEDSPWKEDALQQGQVIAQCVVDGEAYSLYRIPEGDLLGGQAKECGTERR